MLEVLNEPLQGDNSQTESMRQTYYPTAWARIRAAEDAINISSNKRLHIQMMVRTLAPLPSFFVSSLSLNLPSSHYIAITNPYRNNIQNTKWGSGDPNQYLPSNPSFAAYDDHRYIKYSDDDGVNDPTTGNSPTAYLNLSCHDDRGGDSPTIVGEFSLSVANDLEWNDPDFAPPDDHVEWYRTWFAAQILAYERQVGWFFWSWKAGYIGGRNDWRWSYMGELILSTSYLGQIWSVVRG